MTAENSHIYFNQTKEKDSCNLLFVISVFLFMPTRPTTIFRDQL